LSASKGRSLSHVPVNGYPFRSCFPRSHTCFWCLSTSMTVAARSTRAVATGTISSAVSKSVRVVDMKVSPPLGRMEVNERGVQLECTPGCSSPPWPHVSCPRVIAHYPGPPTQAKAGLEWATGPCFLSPRYHAFIQGPPTQAKAGLEWATGLILAMTLTETRFSQ
jgi:hypothetical protein